MILAAVGLQREQRIVAGPGVDAIAGGGDYRRLESLLEGRATKAHGILSIGIAGGLAPGLRSGDWVLADAILVDGAPTPTDPSWTTRLAQRLPQATKGLLIGADAIVTEAAHKADLHRMTSALAVDMESHVVARVARRHGLAFAAARVVSDPAYRTLPPATRIGMKQDGGIDLPAVLRSLLAQPGQLPNLILTGWEAEQAFRSLVGGHRRLRPGLCGPDLGELPLDVT